MAFEPVIVPACGGGLNFTTHPGALEPNEWSWSDGFLAKNGYAETQATYEILSNAALIDANFFPVGILNNPFDFEKSVLVGLINPANGNFHLVRVNPANGGQDEIVWDAVGTRPKGDLFATMHAAFLNGYLVLSFGKGPTAAPGMAKWNGAGLTYSGITQSPSAYFMGAFGGHLIAAVTDQTVVGGHQIAISNVDDPDTWTPGNANTADDATLDDIASVISGVAPLGDAFGLFTRGALYELVSTGGFPPFTRRLALGRGLLDSFNPASIPEFPQSGGQVGVTPYGTIFRGSDDFYLHTGQGLGRKIFDYYLAKDEGAQTPTPGFLHWHDRKGVLIVPVSPPDTGVAEFLYLDPPTGAWSRATLPAGYVPLHHGIIWHDQNAVSAKPIQRHVFIDANHVIYAERQDKAPQAGAFFDTKDFVLADSPLRKAYTARIKVDWEALSNATTDAIEILAYARDDLSRGILGAVGAQTDFSSQFTLRGTLSGGASEVPLRLNAKYVRFRVRCSSGRVRIRGYTIRKQAGSDK